MWKATATLSEHGAWDYRLMRFRDHDSAFKDAFLIKLVEVYYDHDEPSNWVVAELPCTDDLNVGEYASDEEIINNFNKVFLASQINMMQAFSKPLLYEEDFWEQD